MAAKKKSCLMTPDPYHTPGYAGFLPQFKYDIAQTFGIHTHKLLTSKDPKVASSGNSVLCEIFPSSSSSSSSPNATQGNTEFSDSPVYKNTCRSWGDQKYLPHMVPGYSAYIPKGWQQFGSRYAQSCHNAMTSFEADQQTHRKKMEDLRSLTLPTNQLQAKMGGGGGGGDAQQQNSASSSLATPLCPIRSKAKPFYSTPSNKITMSPYSVPQEGQPEEYHISGYMGFVPKAQRYIGQGYPVITSQALRDHALETEMDARSKTLPVVVHRPGEKMPKAVELYPKERGLVPRYSGYVPGQKFRFGATFGCSTREALRAITA